VAGALMGFIFLFLRYKLKGCDVTRRQLYYSEPARSGKEITKELVKTAIPIGVNSLVLSISSMIDSTLIQIRIDDLTNSNRELMQNLYPLVENHVFEDGIFQTYLNGCYGYALTLMMLVTALTQAFGSSALPSLTSAWTRGDREEIKDNIEMILKLTLCVALPAGLALSMLSWPLLNLLYGNGNLSVEVDIASKILQILGISVIFIATSTPICSMLQAVGRVDLPLKLMSIAMVVKISLNYTLVGIPTINIQGAAVGSLVAYLFVVVVGLYFLCKETKIVPDFSHVLIKPLIGALACVVIGTVLYNLLTTSISAKISIIITAVFTVIIYFIALLLLRVVSRREICMLPKGEKIAKLLEKAHILR
ncbi:MAG: polysaccharide biosynthesis C-terminal domain-containing protein, partial [Acutalibacteraceae bacterium]